MIPDHLNLVNHCRPSYTRRFRAASLETLAASTPALPTPDGSFGQAQLSYYPMAAAFCAKKEARGCHFGDSQ